MNNMAKANNNTIEELQKRCALLEQEVNDLNAMLKWYEEQLRLSRRRRFGSSSEQSEPQDYVLQFFNEPEMEAEPQKPEPTVETITYQRRKKTGSREIKLENLPVETIEYRLPEDEMTCSCGNPLHEMSTEVRQEIAIIPAQVKVVKHVRYVYSCRRCDREEINTPVITAAMPAPALPKSLASPSALAYIMDQKYTQGLPLYRQEKGLALMGIDLSRQTMANWMIQGANRWLAPLYDRMHEYLLKQDILYADETTLQVLRESERAPETTSYMWLYRTGRHGPPIILFDYQTTRAGKHPCRFLTGFGGYLHVDGYAGYHGLQDVTLVGCWAHARRKFNDALKALPPGADGKSSAARQGLNFCNQLYAIERGIKDATPDERYETRKACSQPVLNAFLAWLKTQSPQVLPKSASGLAIRYCLGQWDKLTAFMQDGRLEIDNNRSERSIKPFVIGRKNWLFANTPRGARASAIIYSIIETAKENKLNPFMYLKLLFEQLPNIDINDKDELDKLLPWQVSLPDVCRINE